MFAVGSLLAGKYRIDRIIGQGGMGMVVAATHVHLGQPVALKFLLPEYLENRQVVERFVREARASAALRGEHVCRVSDVGTLEQGAPYIVMELLEGHDLSSVIHHGGPMPVNLACDYVLQACVGVAEAHALGIVHRDLKPANLFLTQRPDGMPLIKVLDFGIAKAQGDTAFHLTKTSAVLGSPGYMSPEQLRSSRDVDVRSDVWSIGVILYELVTGRPPFTAESITELAIRVTLDPAPPLVGRMPHGFDQVVNRCLAKDPAHRYPDLANLAHALAAFAGPAGWDCANAVSRVLNIAPRPQTGPVIAVAHPTGGGGGAPTTMGSAASSMATGAAGRGPRWGIAAGIGVVVVAVVGIAIAVSRGGDGDPAVPAATPPAPAAVVAAPDAAPAIDAQELATAPIDAAPAPDAAIEAAAKPPVKKPPVVKKPPIKKPPVKPPGEDLGESRF